MTKRYASSCILIAIVDRTVFPQSNIALFLHATGEFRHSVRFLEHALALNIKYHGEKSLKVAVSYHLVARTQSCMGDFRSALCSEKETYAIYKQLVSGNAQHADVCPFQILGKAVAIRSLRIL